MTNSKQAISPGLKDYLQIFYECDVKYDSQPVLEAFPDKPTETRIIGDVAKLNPMVRSMGYEMARFNHVFSKLSGSDQK